MMMSVRIACPAAWRQSGKSQFLWADFLRRRIKTKLVEDDFGAALTKALTFAKAATADYLPGWCGPSPLD